MLRLWGELSTRSRGPLAATVFVLAVGAGDLLLRPLMDIRAATVVVLVVALVALVAARGTPSRTLVPASVLLFAASVAVSVPVALWRAPDATAGRAEVQGLVAGVAVAVTVTALGRGTVERAVGLRQGWVFALALSVVVGAVELVTGRHLWIEPGLAWAEDHRTIIAGAFRNPNDFAIALSAMISGTLSALSSVRYGRAWRAVIVGLVVLGAVGVTLTQSRSGLLALVAVLVVHAWSVMKGRSSRRGGRTRAVSPRIVVATGVAGLALVAASVLVPALAARNPVLRTLRAAAEPGTARSDGLRIGLIRAALRYLGESDGFGTGAASFEVMLAGDPRAGVASVTWLHNSFLELLLQYGMLPAAGLAFLIVVCLSAAAASVFPRPSTARADARARIARVEVVAMLVVFVALGCASATVLTTPFWWLTLGQAACAAWSLRRGLSDGRSGAGPGATEEGVPSPSATPVGATLSGPSSPMASTPSA